MHRCFVSPESWSGSDVKLTPDGNHHLLHVLRARNGDSVRVFDGCGKEAVARVVLGADEAMLRIVSDVETVSRGTRLVLIQAVPKGKRMDLIVEKATELGAAAVWPVLTERVIVRLTERKRLERAERWQRIALSAARQCGTAHVPDILPVSDYPDVLGRCSAFDLVLLAAVADGARDLRRVVGEERKACRKEGEPNVALFIGPEGDFTDAEVAAAADAGAVVVNLGARVLRTETAALYGLSVLAYEFL